MILVQTTLSAIPGSRDDVAGHPPQDVAGSQEDLPGLHVEG
jgi:hypothetical protein